MTDTNKADEVAAAMDRVGTWMIRWLTIPIVGVWFFGVYGLVVGLVVAATWQSMANERKRTS